MASRSWFFPLDFIKFGTRAMVTQYNSRRATAVPRPVDEATGVTLTRTQSRAGSIHASLYSNRTSFLTKAQRKVGLKKGTTINQSELRRVASHQVAATGSTLMR